MLRARDRWTATLSSGSTSRPSRIDFVAEARLIRTEKLGRTMEVVTTELRW
jgi:hypothetical protein